MLQYSLLAYTPTQCPSPASLAAVCLALSCHWCLSCTLLTSILVTLLSRLLHRRSLMLRYTTEIEHVHMPIYCTVQCPATYHGWAELGRAVLCCAVLCCAVLCFGLSTMSVLDLSDRDNLCRLARSCSMGVSARATGCCLSPLKSLRLWQHTTLLICPPQAKQHLLWQTKLHAPHHQYRSLILTLVRLKLQGTPIPS